MARLLRMPGIAANTHEAVLEQWSVAVDSTFVTGDIIATLETEKAVVDLEAEADGVVARLIVQPGETVAVGAPIAVIAEIGEIIGDIDALIAGGHDVPMNGAQVDAEPRAVSGDPLNQDGGGEESSASARRFASPLARRLARDNGLSIDAIPGTGPNGRIMRRDIDQVLAGLASAQAGAPTSTARAPRDEQPTSTGVDTPHSQMRRTIASRLTESKQSIPHFYVRSVVRAERLVSVQRLLQQDGQTQVSITDLIVKAAARALRLVPDMNVIWTPDSVRRFESVDVAIAVAVEGGLVTPVLRDVDRRPLAVVAAERQNLVERARARRLLPEELTGGTMTVSSLGMFGVQEFDAIINPPQSAILAVGAIRDEAVVERGSIAVGSVMRVSLSVDHRPIDGVIAAEWMRRFTELLEEPALFVG